MEYKLPIIVQSVVYRLNDNKDTEFLLLKRNEGRGGFWNVVNGTLHGDETVAQCARRELAEEIQVSDWVNRSDELHRFSFDYKGAPFTTVVFAVEISPNYPIVINEEHTEYKWLAFDEASELLKFDDDKKALAVTKKFIEQNNITDQVIRTREERNF